MKRTVVSGSTLRYRQWCHATHGHELVCDGNGELVKYEDYAKLERENAELRAENARMAKRLEIDHVTDLEGNVKPFPKSGKDSEDIDGISCRDETIEAQNGRIERLRAEIERLRLPTATSDVQGLVNGLRAEVERMRPVVEAIRPFTHPDLNKINTGNVQGDASPVFGRDAALLTIGDFRKAAEALHNYEATK